MWIKTIKALQKYYVIKKKIALLKYRNRIIFITRLLLSGASGSEDTDTKYCPSQFWSDHDITVSGVVQDLYFLHTKQVFNSTGTRELCPGTREGSATCLSNGRIIQCCLTLHRYFCSRDLSIWNKFPKYSVCQNKTIVVYRNTLRREWCVTCIQPLIYISSSITKVGKLYVYSSYI